MHRLHNNKHCTSIHAQNTIAMYTHKLYITSNRIQVRSTSCTHAPYSYFRGVLNFVIFVVRHEVAKISTHECARTHMRGFTCIRAAVIPRHWRSIDVYSNLSHKTLYAPWSDVHAYMVRVHIISDCACAYIQKMPRNLNHEHYF